MTHQYCHFLACIFYFIAIVADEILKATDGVGPLLIDCGKRKVYLSGADVSLAPKEFDILLLLARDVGKRYTADDIYLQVWGDSLFDKRAVIVHISSLRKKLRMDDESPLTIATEQRKYYCLRAE